MSTTPRMLRSPDDLIAAGLAPRERRAELARIAARYALSLTTDVVELIDAESPWLLGVAQSMLSDPDEAEEVVLEAFSAAWDHVGALGEAHESLMPWLLRITRNRAIDRLRAANLDSLVVTDSIPLRDDQILPQTRVLTIAPLLGEAIKRIHRNESISRLFR